MPDWKLNYQGCSFPNKMSVDFEKKTSSFLSRQSCWFGLVLKTSQHYTTGYSEHILYADLTITGTLKEEKRKILCISELKRPSEIWMHTNHVLTVTHPWVKHGTSTLIWFLFFKSSQTANSSLDPNSKDLTILRDLQIKEVLKFVSSQKNKWTF